MNNPKISVIITCYNQGAFLEETIDSVLNQTVQDVEIIIVNDGSTDPKTIETLNKLDKPKFKVITIKNGGSAVARNAGFKSATGEFIQFLDGDDLLLPEKFNKQLSFLEKNSKFDFCYGNFVYCDANGNEIEPGFIFTSNLGESPIDSILFKYERGLIIKFDTGLFRRSIWKNTLPFNESIRSKEDWIFWVDILLKEIKGKYFNDNFLLFRRHESNKTRDKNLTAKSFSVASFLIYEKLPEKYKIPFAEKSFEHLKTYTNQISIYKEMYEKVSSSNTYKVGHYLLYPFQLVKKYIKH